MRHIWKKLIYINFALMLVLLYGLNIVAVVVDKVTQKYRLEVCQSIVKHSDEFMEYNKHSFTSGCMYEHREMLLIGAFGQPKLEKQILEIFKDQEHSIFLKVKESCEETAERYYDQHKIYDKTIMTIVEEMKCVEIFKDLK